MANDPDPRQFMMKAVVPERALMSGLHEDFSYSFTVYMSNLAGDSDPASSDVIALPGRGVLVLDVCVHACMLCTYIKYPL